MTAGADEHIGGDHGRSAGVGDDADTVSLRDRLGGKSGGGLDQFPLVREGDHTRLLENQVGG